MLRVEDTVERWLPGLLPYGDRITIRQLLTMQSGLIDNNDVVNASDSGQRANMAASATPSCGRGSSPSRAGRPEPRLRVLPDVVDPAGRLQPLLFTPGSGFHYSNIGYDILGLVASRAGGKPLADLYRERIFEPLAPRRDRIRPAGPDPGAPCPRVRHRARRHPVDASTGTGASAPKAASSPTPRRPRGSSQRSCAALVGVRHVEAMKGDTLWCGGARHRLRRTGVRLERRRRRIQDGGLGRPQRKAGRRASP